MAERREKLMFKLKSLPFDHSSRFGGGSAAIREIAGWIKVHSEGEGREVCFVVESLFKFLHKQLGGSTLMMVISFGISW